jgi:hypothetical protein
MRKRLQVKDAKIVVPEKAVLRHCINYLITKGYEPGVDFGRVNTAGTYDAKIKCYRRNPWLLLGMPDIMGFRKTEIMGGGRTIDYTMMPVQLYKMFVIECKSATGKLSTKQESWRDKFVATGGMYILARDVDDLVKAGL